MGSSGERVTELPVVVSQLRRKRNAANVAARKFNKDHVNEVERAILNGIPAQHHEAVLVPPRAHTPSPWMDKAHSTRELYHVGGALVCKVCGSVSAVPRKAPLFKPCRAFDRSKPIVLPSGSQGRVNRLLDGKPLSDWTSWPNGSLCRDKPRMPVARFIPRQS